jgi:hypothetical protein
VEDSMQRRTVLGIAVALCLFVTGVSAHDDYRIIGTVVRIAAPTLEVKQTKDGKTIAMKMDSATIVTRDKKKVALAEVKAGQYVVVDARGDSLEDLVVLEVRLVPPPTK